MVQQVLLTKDMIALVDDADYESVVGSWHASRSRDKWYAARSLPWAKVDDRWRRPKLYLHRFIVDCHDPELMVDHFDGDGLNCTRRNLMVCGETWNSHNSERRSLSGYRGAYLHRVGVWESRIGYKGEQLYLGHFPSPVEAARAYDAKAVELFGPYARTNVREGNLPVLPKLLRAPIRSFQSRERVLEDAVPF